LRHCQAFGWLYIPHVGPQSSFTMFDVLVYLYEHMGMLAACSDHVALTRKLSAAGFERDEIADALYWLQGLADIARESVSAEDEAQRAFRIYTAEEYERLGSEAINFLVFLERSNLLTVSQREIVIERAWATPEAPISMAKFKVIVLMVLWSLQANIDLLVMEELLDHREERALH